MDKLVAYWDIDREMVTEGWHTWDMLVVAAVIEKLWSEDGDTDEHRKQHRWPEYKSKGKLRWSWRHQHNTTLVVVVQQQVWGVQELGGGDSFGILYVSFRSIKWCGQWLKKMFRMAGSGRVNAWMAMEKPLKNYTVEEEHQRKRRNEKTKLKLALIPC